MTKQEYEKLILYPNDGKGPPLLPVALGEMNEPIYFYRGRFCANLGSGFLRLDLENNQIRGINIVDLC
jgi:hypothetical protein